MTNMAAKEENQVDVFDVLATKFAQLLIGRKEGDRARINKALDSLNSLDYRYPVITNTTVSYKFPVSLFLITVMFF